MERMDSSQSLERQMSMKEASKSDRERENQTDQQLKGRRIKKPSGAKDTGRYISKRWRKYKKAREFLPPQNSVDGTIFRESDGYQTVLVTSRIMASSLSEGIRRDIIILVRMLWHSKIGGCEERIENSGGHGSSCRRTRC